MPWNDNANNGGGPWGSGGNGGGKNPWGQGPQGSGGGGGAQPPDLEKAFRDARDRFKGFGGGKGGGLAIIVFAIVAMVAWGMTGIYIVQPQEQGVVLRFGEYNRTTQPGINYHLPWPVERVYTPEVTRQQQTNIGFVEFRNDDKRDVATESLMLTGDENIVDVDVAVLWVIADPAAYLFNVDDPEGTVKAVAESALREVVGKAALNDVLNDGRAQVETDTRAIAQDTLDQYDAGIQVQQVQLQDVKAPDRVQAAFQDVIDARQDAQATVNRANAYLNQIVPEARGTAAQIIQEAEAYREQVVADATGEAARFSSILNEYLQAPDITRQRMYLETIERVFAKTDKILIDETGGSGVVPYLPLSEVNRNRQNAQGGE